MTVLSRYLLLAISAFVVGHLYGQSVNPINTACSNYLSDKDKFTSEVKRLIIQEGLGNEELSIGHALRSLSFDPTEDMDSVTYYIDRSSECLSDRCKGYTAAARSRMPVIKERGREAIDLILESIHNLDPIQDQYMYMIMNQSAAGVYYWMSDYERSNKYVQVALQNAIELDYPWSIAAAYDVLANGWSGEDDVKADSFRVLYYQSIENIDDFDYQFEKLINQGFSLQNKDYDDSARVFFQNAFDMARDSGDLYSEVEALTYLAENSFWKKRYQETIDQYEQAMAYPPEYVDDPGAIRAYNYWSQAYAGLGKYEKAYEYMRKYKETDDEYWDYSSREQSNELEAKYESIRKEAELANQQLQIQKRTSQRNLLFFLGLGLLALASFLYYRYQKNQKLSISTISNLEKQQQLMALDYMVQGQEEERKRIAQDLHDGLGGILTTARLQIQNVQTEINKLGELDLLNKAEVMINNACSEVRRISHDMMPGALIDLGLVDAVEDLAAKIMLDNKIEIEIKDHTGDLIIDDNHKIQLYRILQELLNNTLKHAEANKINIVFNVEKDKFHITYDDDGIGLSPSKLRDADGLGMRNMESRIKFLNGSMKIDSAPQDGTRFIIQVNL